MKLKTLKTTYCLPVFKQEHPKRELCWSGNPLQDLPVVYGVFNQGIFVDINTLFDEYYIIAKTKGEAYILLKKIERFCRAQYFDWVNKVCALIVDEKTLNYILKGVKETEKFIIENIYNPFFERRPLCKMCNSWKATVTLPDNSDYCMDCAIREGYLK